MYNGHQEQTVIQSMLIMCSHYQAIWVPQYLYQVHTRIHGKCHTLMVLTMQTMVQCIRLYCNIVKSKTNPLLVNIPMDSLYKNYFYKNRMLIPCSELLDRIEYELKDENDESLSFIGNVYLLIGFTVVRK